MRDIKKLRQIMKTLNDDVISTEYVYNCHIFDSKTPKIDKYANQSVYLIISEALKKLKKEDIRKFDTDIKKMFYSWTVTLDVIKTLLDNDNAVSAATAASYTLSLSSAIIRSCKTLYRMNDDDNFIISSVETHARCEIISHESGATAVLRLMSNQLGIVKATKD